MLQRSSAEFKQIVIHRILTNGLMKAGVVSYSGRCWGFTKNSINKALIMASLNFLPLLQILSHV